jgi:hypothetical protein
MDYQQTSETVIGWHCENVYTDSVFTGQDCVATDLDTFSACSPDFPCRVLSGTSTPQAVYDQSTVLGLGIIVVMGFLMVIGFIFNHLNQKKPWL